ncbi:excinuclease ABC subunit C [Candidatus Desantisbacteria bacterium CG_4_10_14_0_8_um_filter_48_22]|uniref:Excinuclease ABC subunit C n=1 Tax=Candidatus Desantisbacteria bacterium CG_4_10_14_0_8_um_filter_48_22 TaxID=1974543 RepID=A0A2M7S9C3_9BACT|nr:MAG: hypothetical protein AUJ67_06590 [Candidatus Desantisbacteria bacterium CG1_02_49_89]PIV57498.1 MAG: excinuclease ABC subunit C [Candidatus Desantisbacteria bacterium CG02_land_8_20_14_3_00_49_13]PIZ16101.1 MAG: excinuclease ABC subunit C [Candidatus Desantisbacteria bacterium CG_4_10_14_0_8_um_filter_48_22]
MYYVYILKSEKDGKHYIGMTSNLELRLAEHNNGSVKSTQNRTPLKIIHYESYPDKKDATKRERFLKTGKGREFIKLIDN